MEYAKAEDRLSSIDEVKKRLFDDHGIEIKDFKLLHIVHK